MPDYNLSSLSPRSFEQLIQSLALKFFSPATVIFGDGPDGGREATYRGRAIYPSAALPWDGYTVIQAKFKQKPEGTAADGSWLLQQLKAELAKFTDRDKGLVRPQYYLLCTNVALSSVSRTGAKDAAFKLLGRSRPKYGLRDFDIWDFDKIRGYLDGAVDIRAAYAAWITPGDVLSAVMSYVNAKPDFSETMASFLQKELLAEQYVNLKQAGHVSDRETEIAQVFVDLPYSDTPNGDAPKETVIAPGGFAHDFLAAGDLKIGAFDHFVQRMGRSSRQRTDGKRDDAPFHNSGRLVLVGGPGQGKSTIGQYICQMYRVAILRDRSKLPLEAKSTIANIAQSCEKDGLSLPHARRFPLRVVLSVFADWLENSSEGASVLSFLASRIRFRTDRQVTVDVLREWLSTYSWILVLDGLDEVPSASNRAAVLSAIKELWVDLQGTDVLVLATTRPQGYNEDFSPNFYEHCYLLPLSPARAIHYAERLSAVRYGHDQDRQNRVLGHMRRAAETPSTARLIGSPLQVTIMATLVDQSGPPPENRWRLFREYFQVIYRREMEREIKASELLRTHMDLIKGIHNDIGLRLQLEAEQSGQTSARLPVEAVRRAAVARALATGFSQAEAQGLAEMIIETAANRLVFLTGVQEGQIGFEIRSLQEFFAAAAIICGPDGEIVRRLTCIAALPYWRNVFLFAAGGLLAERSYFHKSLLGICSELNSSLDHCHRVARTGSLLALDLLEDISATGAPGYATALLDIALSLTERPKEGTSRRLARFCSGTLEQLFVRKLTTHLSGTHEGFSDGAWGLAMRLLPGSHNWVSDLVRNRWPISRHFEIAILRDEGSVQLDWIIARAVGLGVQGTERLQSLFTPPSILPERYAIFQKMRFRELGVNRDEEYIPVVSKRSRNVFFVSGLTGLNDEECRLILATEFDSPFWLVARAEARFCLSPAISSLAELLETIASLWSFEAYRYGIGKPWLLGMCIDQAETADDALALAKQVRAGKLGTAEDWATLEKSWEQDGIELSDVSKEPLVGPPWTLHPGLNGWKVMMISELGVFVEDCVAQFPSIALVGIPQRCYLSLSV